MAVRCFWVERSAANALISYRLLLKGTCMNSLGPTNDAAPALLMCGLRPLLLETRTRVLQHAGFAVHIASSPEEAGKRLLARRYLMLLICHSVGDRDLAELQAMAAQAGLPMHLIEPLTPPENLIAEVNRTLRRTWTSGAA